jgi:hypothetical protein
VSDSEDASVHRMQPAARKAVVDRVIAQAERPELPPGDNAVLRVGEAGDDRIGATRRTFTVHIPVNVRSVSHRPIVAASV